MFVREEEIFDEGEKTTQQTQKIRIGKQIRINAFLPKISHTNYVSVYVCVNTCMPWGSNEMQISSFMNNFFSQNKQCSTFILLVIESEYEIFGWKFYSAK